MKKGKRRILVLSGILAALTVYAGINLDIYMHTMGLAKQPVMKPRFETVWQSEDEWIIRSILTDIYGMVSYHASDGRFSYDDLKIKVRRVRYRESESLETLAAYKIEAGLPGLTEKIVFTLDFELDDAHIFSPQAYWDWVRVLLDLMVPDLPAPSPHRDENAAILEALLTPTSAVMVQESRRLSDKLAVNSLDPHLHHQAALLLGMMSMREASGKYKDLRPNLCRSTAHLAMARALLPSSPEDLLSTMARAVHNLLLDHQTAALDLIDALDLRGDKSSATVVLRAWQDALYTRITGDWRRVKEKSARTLLEKMALFGALCRSVSSDRALAWIRENEDNEIPFNEAARVVAEGEYGVGAGHLLMKNSLASELHELVYLFNQPALSSDAGQLVAFLNQRGGAYAVDVDAAGRATFDVISTGSWSAYFQRIILHRLSNEYRFYKAMWGVEDRARAFYASTREHFSGLTLFPVYMRVCAQDQADRKAAKHMIKPVIRKSPEAVTPQCFIPFKNRQGEPWVMGNAFFDLEYGWYIRGLLPGTIYQMAPRAQCFVTEHQRLKFYGAALKKAPYRLDYIDFYQKRLHRAEDVSGEALKRICAPLLDFNLKALKTLAEWHHYHGSQQVEEKIDLLRRICRIDPDEYFMLGKTLAGLGRDEEAAHAYQQGVDKALSRVNMANQTEWLVFYYYDQGKEEKAREIAEMSAKVGSYIGFRTMARLHEKMNDLTGAETYYRKITERYNDPAILIRFFQKHESNPAFRSKSDELIREIFPDGLESVTVEDAAGPPAEGLVFVKSEGWMRQHRLKIGDVVVAVNGVRVKNKPQFLAAAAYRSQSPTGHMIVWHNGQYLEVKTRRQFIYISSAVEPYFKAGV